MGHCCKFSWLPLLKYSGLPQVQQNTFAVTTSIGLFLKAVAVPQENRKTSTHNQPDRGPAVGAAAVPHLEGPWSLLPTAALQTRAKDQLHRPKCLCGGICDGFYGCFLHSSTRDTKKALVLSSQLTPT